MCGSATGLVDGGASSLSTLTAPGVGSVLARTGARPAPWLPTSLSPPASVPWAGVEVRTLETRDGGADPGREGGVDAPNRDGPADTGEAESGERGAVNVAEREGGGVERAARSARVGACECECE